MAETKKPEQPAAFAKPVAAPSAPLPAPAPDAERKIAPMEAIRFKGIEYARESWLCTCFDNTRPADLLKPEYWANVSSSLRPRARVEAWANDGTWMAEFVVLEAGRNWAKVHMLAEHMLTTADVALTQAEVFSPYLVTHRGPHSQWSVVRKSDNQVLHEGEATQHGAQDWLREHLKAQK